MSRRLPSLNAMRVFEAVARHRSFARAAEELHVTPAAVSQQIRLLEDDINITLFSRGKTIGLTQPAETMLPLVSEAFDQLERAIVKIRTRHDNGPLVVSSPPAFTARWLIPRLDDFQSAHPDIELRLMATRKLVDFSREDVDLAIRFGAGDYPELRVERLMTESIVPVAAPKLAAAIKSPEDLMSCNLLQDEWHIEKGVFPDWKTWLTSFGLNTDTPLRIQSFGDVNLAIHAAVAGMGVTLAWRSLVEDDLKEGKLIHLLNHALPTNLGFHLVIPENRANHGKVVAFRNWLMDKVNTSPSA